MTDQPQRPDTVKIGPVHYRITTDPDEWMRIEHQLRRSGDYGYSMHQQAVIYLNPEATDEVNRLSLWHEILHALFETTMGSPEWRGLGKDKDTREEAIIRRLEAPTLTVLRENPDLTAYLTA